MFLAHSCEVTVVGRSLKNYHGFFEELEEARKQINFFGCDLEWDPEIEKLEKHCAEFKI